MAVTKIKPVKGGLKRAVEYIQNPAKTDGKMLVSSFRCSYETADIEFELTLSKALAKGNNLAHHLIQSFEPGEATPEQAHEIGKRLADEILKGRYEYVLTTHIDKHHVHNHLLFCAASHVDYKKYVSNKKSYYAIRNASDRLCKEYGLSVVRPGQDKGRSYAEYDADRNGGGSWKSRLKAAIDMAIPQSTDLESLLKCLREQGYEIKRGKYISVRAPGQERFTRTKTLGADYTEDAITKRIAGVYILNTPQHRGNEKIVDFTFDTPDTLDVDSDNLNGDMSNMEIPEKNIYKQPAPAVNLIMDVENSVKAQQNAGFARWQKIQNLKEAAKTLNFLTENKLLKYTDLETKADEATTAFDETAGELKAAEKRLANMASLMKHITAYQQSKSVYDGMKTAKDKNAYHREHESMIIIHEAAVKALRPYAGDGRKLPNPDTLVADYNRLTDKKNMLISEYYRLKKLSREYGVVKRNVDSILNPDIDRVRVKSRNTEL